MTRTTTLLTALALATPAIAQDEEAGSSIAGAFFIQRHASTGAVEWLGSGITWLLMALSVLCLALLVAGALTIRRSAMVPCAQVHNSRTSNANAKACAEESTTYARVLGAALEELEHSEEHAIRAAEQEGESALLDRVRSIEALSIVGNVAPMIGLFGTVYGMIVAFREIVASGGTPDAVGLAAGIGTALTTTFWGLVVAIPALAGHALLRNRAEGFTLEAIREAERTIEHLAHEQGDA